MSRTQHPRQCGWRHWAPTPTGREGPDPSSHALPLVLGASVPGAPRALARPPTPGVTAPRAEPAAQPDSSPRSMIPDEQRQKATTLHSLSLSFFGFISLLLSNALDQPGILIFKLLALQDMH